MFTVLITWILLIQWLRTCDFYIPELSPRAFRCSILSYKSVHNPSARAYNLSTKSHVFTPVIEVRKEDQHDSVCTSISALFRLLVQRDKNSNTVTLIATCFLVETSVIGTERKLRRRLRNKKENHQYATLFHITRVIEKEDGQILSRVWLGLFGLLIESFVKEGCQSKAEPVLCWLSFSYFFDFFRSPDPRCNETRKLLQKLWGRSKWKVCKNHFFRLPVIRHHMHSCMLHLPSFSQHYGSWLSNFLPHCCFSDGEESRWSSRGRGRGSREEVASVGMLGEGLGTWFIRRCGELRIPFPFAQRFQYPLDPSNFEASPVSFLRPPPPSACNRFSTWFH